MDTHSTERATVAGRTVTRAELDAKAADAVIAVRKAFVLVENVKSFLDNTPQNAEGGDPLTLSTTPTDPMDPTTAPGVFGYTDDEAYLMRIVFDQLSALPVQDTLHTARKLTGLD